MRLRRYGLLFTVLVVCLLFLTVQTRSEGKGKAADAVALLVAPVQSFLVDVHRGALNIWVNYVDWKSVRRQNAALRAEAQQLRLESLQVEEARQENVRLRRLLELHERLPLTTLAGDVVGRELNGWVRSLMVNRGESSGVKPLTPVIVPEGLVGRVIRVRNGDAVIQLLNDPVSSVGAAVLRTRAPGIVEGGNDGVVRLKFLARDRGQVALGDLVVTSGTSSVFPKGLPIGKVVEIKDKGAAFFHEAVLAPIVDFGRVEEVLLLTGQTPQDLAGRFAPES